MESSNTTSNIVAPKLTTVSIDAHENLACDSSACPEASSSLPLTVLGGTVTCGFPCPAEDFFREKDRLDLNAELVPNPHASFFVQADCGGSMADFGIQDSDLLVVDYSIGPRTSPEPSTPHSADSCRRCRQ